jgi:dihydroorotase
VTVIDPNRVWTVDAKEFRSKGRNTPFNGWEVTGRAVLTMVGGRVVHRDATLGRRSEPAGAARVVARPPA